MQQGMILHRQRRGKPWERTIADSTASHAKPSNGPRSTGRCAFRPERRVCGTHEQPCQGRVGSKTSVPFWSVMPSRYRCPHIPAWPSLRSQKPGTLPECLMQRCAQRPWRALWALRQRSMARGALPGASGCTDRPRVNGELLLEPRMAIAPAAGPPTRLYQILNALPGRIDNDGPNDWERPTMKLPLPTFP